MAQKLELFYRPTCPYCVRVLDVIQQRGAEITLRNISEDAQAETTLVEVGGKRQVPCLFIDGTPMYESGDIIAWIEKNL